MDQGVLEQATQMANRVGHVFVATADANKWPHLAVARRLILKEHDRVAVEEWFCPGTMENLRLNSHVSVVIWDRNVDKGFQLIGDTERVSDIGVLDGYFPKENNKTIPQTESKIVIKVKKIIDFTRSPHSDIEE
jgi:hypothetical protein